MDSNSIAVFVAAPVRSRNGDVDYKFRQESNLLYLAGLLEDRCALLISKTPVTIGGKSVREILFVKERNAMSEQWTGPSIGIARAKEMTGAEEVLPMKNLKAIIDSLLPTQSTLYYSPQSLPFLNDPVTGYSVAADREWKKELGKKYPALKIKSSGGLVAQFRVIKSKEEVALIQRAIDATVAGYIEATKSAKPGMYEYELQAIVEYCFARFGCEYTAFPSIVGSGPNSTILHYEANRRQMKQGDLVVMDIGGEYAGYAADVTRTIPVSGTFTKAQKELYAIVLKAQRAAIEKVKAGASMRDVSDAAQQVISDAGFGDYFTHGLSHQLGIDVHDVGSMISTLKEGMVITIEPGIYIREGSSAKREYWNIGIRIEDDVLVTKDGCVVLSAAAPKTIEEIESLMKQKGLGDQPIGGAK